LLVSYYFQLNKFKLFISQSEVDSESFIKCIECLIRNDVSKFQYNNYHYYASSSDGKVNSNNNNFNCKFCIIHKETSNLRKENIDGDSNDSSSRSRF